MTFSGALTLTDLDDFLAPSQACIVPVKQTNKVVGQEDGVSANTEIQIDAANNYYEVALPGRGSGGVETAAAGSTSKPFLSANGDLGKSNGIAQPLQKAEISLNDCLACSGCVTSTESMLITLQSHLEVQTYIDSRSSATDGSQRAGILSISPQSLASLVASYPSFGPSLSPRRLLRRIRAFLSRTEHGGWAGVWDTTFARHLALLEHVREFRERQARTAAKGKGREGDVAGSEEQPVLPMLASACPGWVCYAEKAQGDLLGLMSATRSPQAVMGALVKQWWAGRQGRSPSDVYHVTVMPCYDKKLEASRSDFYSTMHETRDVDCVLTTGELDLLLRERGFDPAVPVDGEDAEEPNLASCPLPEMLEHSGTSSGSYLHTLMVEIERTSSTPLRRHVKPIRNSEDHVEYLLEDEATGDIIFKGAKCYGFRNLQNLVRRVSKETGIGKAGAGRAGGAGKLSAAVAARRRAGKVAKASAEGGEAGAAAAIKHDEKRLDYVEVMACPGGCVNGGGQMKPSSPRPAAERDEEGYIRDWAAEGVEKPEQAQVDEGMRWSTKAWVAKVEAVYWSGLPTPPASPSLKAEEPAHRRVKHADAMAADILRDVCRPTSSWCNAHNAMDEAAEARRRDFLRTAYQRVETDILGLSNTKW